MAELRLLVKEQQASLVMSDSAQTNSADKDKRIQIGGFSATPGVKTLRGTLQSGREEGGMRDCIDSVLHVHVVTRGLGEG